MLVVARSERGRRVTSRGVAAAGAFDRRRWHADHNSISWEERCLDPDATIPKLIGPDLQHLLDSVGADDPGWDTEALIRVAADIDTFQQRARLADALVRLRDQARITRFQAAVAILDLGSSSTRFVDSSLIEAIALTAGAIPTPGGLQLAA